MPLHVHHLAHKWELFVTNTSEVVVCSTQLGREFTSLEFQNEQLQSTSVPHQQQPPHQVKPTTQILKFHPIDGSFEIDSI